MSTYSPSLRIELITTGDQAGTWGNTTNSNLGTLIESAIAGYTSVAVASANQALTALNGAADQARNQTLALTTSTGAAFNVYAPPAEKTYVIYNASSYTATIYNSTVLGNTTAAGTGVAIPAGKTVTVWSDGTNFAFQNDHLPSLSLDTDLAVADGGTGASTASGARTNLGLVIGTDVPSPTGGGASGTWNIAISGNAATATTATSATTATNATNASLATYATTAGYATTSGNGGVTSVDSATGGVSLSTLPAFAKSLATNGYQKLPGGLIIQWGTAPQNVKTVTFPLAFPTACLNVNLSLKDVTYTGSSSGQYSSTENWTTTTFDLTVANTTLGGSRPWIAIGY